MIPILKKILSLPRNIKQIIMIVFDIFAIENKTFLTKLIFREKKGSKVRFLIQDIFTSGQSDCSASFLV